MIVLDITNDISFEKKVNLKPIFDTYTRIRGVICKGLSCIDLMNLDDIVQVNELVGNRYCLIYHFHDLESNQRFFVGVPLLFGQTVDSYAHYWPSIKFFEKEINQNFGIKFYSNERIKKEIIEKDNLEFLDKDNTKPEKIDTLLSSNSLNVDIKTETSTLIFDDLSTGSLNLRMNLAHQGSSIKQANVQCEDFIGLEKIFENIDIEHVSKYITHINPYNWLPYSILWAETKETIQNTESSYYVKMKRMLFLEISNAFENIANLHDLFKLFREDEISHSFHVLKKKIRTHLHQYDDMRPHPHLFEDPNNQKIDDAWLRALADIVKGSTVDVEDLRAIVINLNNVIDNTSKYTCRLNPLIYGLTSIPLRSAGISSDIRRDEHFYFYDEMNISVPLGIAGSGFDTILLRFQEILESLSNIVRIIESFPVYTDKKSPAGQKFKKSDRILLSIAQSSAGEINFLTVCSGVTKELHRLHVLTPSMRMLEYFCKRCTVLEKTRIEADWVLLGLSSSELTK